MQLENYVEGAKCLFSFYNREDELGLTNFPFYRQKLELKEGEFVWREPGISNPTRQHTLQVGIYVGQSSIYHIRFYTSTVYGWC